MKKLLLLALMGLMTIQVSAQRVTDKLDRGLVAVPSGNGILVTWRKFGSEYYDTQYNLYRDDTKIAGPISVSNYLDATGTTKSTYVVEPVVRGVAQAKSAAVKAWTANYKDVPLQPVVNRAGVTKANSNTVRTSDGYEGDNGYVINDVSLADVTGDGVCEFIVKRNNRTGNLRSASNQTDFNLYECYKMDGTRLWWIDLGPNLMAGADEQWDMIGYDWDEDGKAEMIMRGADNMIIHTSTGKTINIGNMTAGFGNYDRPEYMGVGNEYLLYLNGETGEPYGWDGSENWTPMAYPLPQFETGETYGSSNVWGDLGHRMMKHYFGAPYLDGRHASIFLGRGCYTRHKFCALDVNPANHELTPRWRWNCYDGGSPWFGNGFHNYQIADVDMDGRDEIMFGSMTIDDTGFGLATTGLGHGDAQHCGDLDPYRWGLEQFTCQEGSQGNSYWNATTGQIYYRKADGGDDGRSLAGNFSNSYPGGQGRSVSSGVIGLTCDKVVDTNGDAMSGSYSNLNMRVFWDGDLLDEIFNCPTGTAREPKVMKWGGSVIRAFGDDVITNNDSKCNPSAQGDILGDWREEIVLRLRNNSALRIFTTTYSTNYDLYTLWDDHEYRNAMTWQCVGYNQPPHPSFFLGELEEITIAPPPTILQGRTEVTGTIQSTSDHLLVSGYENKTISVADGASPWVLTVNAPAWVQGTGSKQATSSTPKSPARNVITYTTTLTGGAFGGATRLVKQGEGVLVLPNVVEKHTGATDVWNGTLQFDGTFEKSPLWLNRHTTLISNGGKFLGGIKADYNATIYPGGKNNVGSVTTSNLTLGFGSRVVIDYAGGQFDQVNADTMSIVVKTSSLWLSYGPRYKAPVLEFTGVSDIALGTYTLGNIAELEGNLPQVIIEGFGSDKKVSLAHNDGKLQLIVEEMRDASTIIWNGSVGQNVWQQAVSEVFLSDNDSTYSAVGDNVIFDDNAAITSVVIKGAVSPATVTFNNETKIYTVTGDSIVGGATITKNGAARVNISNVNHTGATTINGGSLAVTLLANNSGQAYGSLGGVSSPIYLNDGGTLVANGSITTDQTLNVNGDVRIDVPSSKSVTFTKAIKGSSATITKTGDGSMTTGSQSSTYAKLIIAGGTVNSNYSSSNVDMLPKTVEFQGGTLWGANMEGGNGVSNTTNFIVPEGKTGSFYSSFRGTYTGTLTGSGTFNVYTGGVRAYFNGNWSNFEGTINIGKNNRQNKKSYDPNFYLGNSSGMPKATVNVNANARLDNQGKTIRVKKFGGTGALVGSGTWIVDCDEDFTLTTEVGITSERTDDYGGTIGVSASPLTKRGTGKMKMNVGKMNGVLTVENGAVTVYDILRKNLLNGNNSVMVKTNGRFVGQAKVYIMNVLTGGELIPCASSSNETTPGILVCEKSAVVSEGGTATFLVNATKNSTINAVNMTFNGTLKLKFTADRELKVGDELKLWTLTGTFSGTPQFDLPDNYTWDTSRISEGVLVVTGVNSGIVAPFADPDPCNVYSLNGVLVSRQQSGTATVGLPAGIYIRGGKKIIVK